MSNIYAEFDVFELALIVAAHVCLASSEACSGVGSTALSPHVCSRVRSRAHQAHPLLLSGRGGGRNEKGGRKDGFRSRTL